MSRTTQLHTGNQNLITSATSASFAVSASWAPGASGTVTSIVAGSGLSGGTITSTGTISLDTSSAHFTNGVKSKLNTDNVVSSSAQISHTATTGYVANEHINHTSVSITAGTGLTGGGDLTTSRTLALTGQALALHNLSTNGVIVRTGVGTVTARTITGTSNQITVTNGDGVSGNPTLSLPQSINTSAAVQFGSLGVGTAASATTGEIRATNEITAYYSDARLKNFHGTIQNAGSKVAALNGYYFTENELAKSLGYNNNTVQIGVSAQEVQAVLPEAVVPAPIDETYLTVKYEKIVPLLIEAIKELQAEIAALKVER